MKVPCPTCKGTLRYGGNPCPRCAETGTVDLGAAQMRVTPHTAEAGERALRTAMVACRVSGALHWARVLAHAFAIHIPRTPVVAVMALVNVPHAEARAICLAWLEGLRDEERRLRFKLAQARTHEERKPARVMLALVVDETERWRQLLKEPRP